MIPTPDPAEDANAERDLGLYLEGLVHASLRTLTALGFTLVPLFFLLDVVIISPAYRGLLPRFALYRAVATAVVAGQYAVLRRSKPSPHGFLHAYLFTGLVAGIIAQMSAELGGFDSGYYAGLLLVVTAVNMLLPWRPIHSVVCSVMITALYLALNMAAGARGEKYNLVSNLAFMSGMIVIAVSVTRVRHGLVRREFFLRRQVERARLSLEASEQALRSARDALWSEMEVAKHIQTSLLPQNDALPGIVAATAMLPADEVGGDYCDLIEARGSRFIAVGDVSGHGVESGLIMMMAHTAIRTVIHNDPSLSPKQVIARVSSTLKGNIAKLGTSRYMTLCLTKLSESGLVAAGMHQDIFVYRSSSCEIERVQVQGAWVGVVDDIEPYLEEVFVPLSSGDLVMLFTDGITEATSPGGEMFGEDRLGDVLRSHAAEPPEEIVRTVLAAVRELEGEGAKAADDRTLVVARWP